MIKLFCLALLLFLPISNYSQSGWFLQQSGTDVFLWDIEFLDSITGFIGGDAGRIVKTTNAGVNWTTSVIDPSVNFIAMDFVNSNTGYLAGTGGKMYKTTNSGTNWQFMPTPVTFSIQNIHFVNDNTGFFIGGTSLPTGKIYRTANAGLNWVETGPGVSFGMGLSICFPNETTGYVSCFDGKLIKTTNAGINWSVIITGLAGGSPSVHFPNTDTGYILNSLGDIGKTVNSGVNWQLIYGDTTYGLANIYFVNGLTGFVVGGRLETGGVSQLVMRTNNGGENWFSELLPNLGHLNNIFFTSPLVGYISSEHGLIYKTTNGGNPIGIIKLSENIPTDYVLSQNYPNPFNPATKIRFSFPIPSKGADTYVKLLVYDVIGRELETLVNENLLPGTYEVTWDGSKYASGFYFYRITTGDFALNKRMILLK